MNSDGYLPSRISITFTDTEVNNCFSIYHTSWIISGPKRYFTGDKWSEIQIISCRFSRRWIVLANHLRVNQSDGEKSTIHLCGIYQWWIWYKINSHPFSLNFHRSFYRQSSEISFSIYFFTIFLLQINPVGWYCNYFNGIKQCPIIKEQFMAFCLL